VDAEGCRSISTTPGMLWSVDSHPRVPSAGHHRTALTSDILFGALLDTSRPQGAGRCLYPAPREVVGGIFEVGEYGRVPSVQRLTRATDIHPKTPVSTKIIKGYLAKSMFFRSLGPEEMTVVIFAMRPREVKPGERLITIGAKGDSMFLVVSGALDCVIPINGTDTVVKTVHAGDIVGELAILYNRPRAASVVCRKQATVLELHGSVFWAVAKQCPEQWKLVVRTIFDYFDSDKSGQIDKEEVRLAMRSLGAILSEKELDDFMRRHDSDGNGEIDLLEFTEMLEELPSRYANFEDITPPKEVI